MTKQKFAKQDYLIKQREMIPIEKFMVPRIPCCIGVVDCGVPCTLLWVE